MKRKLVCLFFLAALIFNSSILVYADSSAYNQTLPQKIIEIFDLGVGVKLEMVKVKAGTFIMGSPTNEKDRGKDEREHRVTLTSDYYIGKYEITQKQWEAVMNSNPSKFKGDNLPVEQVSWKDCQEFIKKLNQKTSKKFRLPTEAEWEYAARGGQEFIYAGSNELFEVGWYLSNSGSKVHSVGEKRANAYGIYDMSGNVWEWCEDWFGDYPSGTVTDPTGAKSSLLRVFRGGSWNRNARGCRVALRNGSTPTFRYFNLGFRLVLVCEQ